MEEKKMHPKLKVALQLAGSAVCLFLCLWYRGIFSASTKSDVMRILSDSCFIVGGVLTGIGVISFCIKQGAFSVGGTQEEKKELSEKRRWLRTLTFCGLFLLVMANIFAFI